MREPALVADCMAAMRGAVRAPVDGQVPDRRRRAGPGREPLFGLVDACAAAGVSTFVVHARKAWLKGLSPKENREIPPLDYPLVYRLKAERPGL